MARRRSRFERPHEGSAITFVVKPARRNQRHHEAQIRGRGEDDAGNSFRFNRPAVTLRSDTTPSGGSDEPCPACGGRLSMRPAALPSDRRAGLADTLLLQRMPAADRVRLWREPAQSEFVDIKPRTLDDPSGLAPSLECWTRRKSPWLTSPASPQVSTPGLAERPRGEAGQAEEQFTPPPYRAAGHPEKTVTITRS
jgi:hypothetical protein